jgi:energy-coupling factor transporter ATP-binding protein EcfA2
MSLIDELISETGTLLPDLTNERMSEQVAKRVRELAISLIDGQHKEVGNSDLAEALYMKARLLSSEISAQGRPTNKLLEEIRETTGLIYRRLLRAKNSPSDKYSESGEFKRSRRIPSTPASIQGALPFTNQGVQSRYGIERIEIAGLFDTNIDSLIELDMSSPERQRLSVLYGDNGSGKTTILNLLNRALDSSSRKSRSHMARVPFTDLAIETGNLRLTAERTAAPLRLHINALSKITNIETSLDYFEDSVGRIQSIQGESNLLRILRRAPKVRFLRESRIPFDFSDDEGLELKAPHYSGTGASPRASISRMSGVSGDPLVAVVNRMETHLRRRMIECANAADVKESHIYETILSKLVNSGELEVSNDSLNALLSRVPLLQERIQRFERSGVSPRIDLSNLLPQLDGSSSRNISPISQVLSAYFDTITARLDAMSEVENTLSVFKDCMSIFFKGKEVHFSIAEGLRISAKSGKALRLSDLSSGERQLIFMFCTLIAAKDEVDVFLIDEPELSLNIKWQRQFIPSLLLLAGRRPIQFIVATHSHEMIAQHRDHWLRIES